MQSILCLYQNPADNTNLNLYFSLENGTKKVYHIYNYSLNFTSFVRFLCIIMNAYNKWNVFCACKRNWIPQTDNKNLDRHLLRKAFLLPYKRISNLLNLSEILLPQKNLQQTPTVITPLCMSKLFHPVEHDIVYTVIVMYTPRNLPWLFHSHLKKNFIYIHTELYS